jgi:hypothetical protein
MQLDGRKNNTGWGVGEKGGGVASETLNSRVLLI